MEEFPDYYLVIKQIRLSILWPKYKSWFPQKFTHSLKADYVAVPLPGISVTAINGSWELQQ